MTAAALGAHWRATVRGFTRSRRSRGAICVAVLACSLVGTTRAADASRIDDVRAEARRIASQIEANGERISALGEQYDGATLRLADLRAQQRLAARALVEAQRGAAHARASAVALAQRLYLSASPDAGDSLFTSAPLDDAERSVYT